MTETTLFQRKQKLELGCKCSVESGGISSWIGDRYDFTSRTGLTGKA